MVNLWWIAGESWYVGGHFSGSKNMPLFPDLFLVAIYFSTWQLCSFLSSSFGSMR
jgi:hypothetical protein